MSRRVEIATRLWNRVEPVSSGCWEWQGPTNNRGYGVIGRGGRGAGMVLVHRVVWSFLHGPIPDGLCVCHHCDYRRCVRPSHLFSGTPADNSRDMVEKARKERGEDHHNAKLTVDDVRSIRLRLAGCRQRTLAAEYGVSEVCISNIKSGARWGWLQ